MIAGRGNSPHRFDAALADVRIGVETTQIAPTILRLLGLNPGKLQAVQQEHPSSLPILRLPLTIH